MPIRSTILWVLSGALLTLIFYAVFAPNMGAEAAQVLGVRIEYGAVFLGLTMAAKLVALLLSSGTLLMYVPPLGLAAGITGLLLPLVHIGVPVVNFFYLAFFLTRMIPNLIQESRMIALAQRSRGVSLGRWRSYPAFVLPIFALTLRRSDAVALVLTSRGFDSQRIPASVQGLKLGLADYIALSALTGGWIVWLYLRVQ